MLGKVVREGDVVIDATCGNGYDTLSLAKAVGEGGAVLAFDVQEAAISAAKARIESAGYGNRGSFFHESHAGMAAHAAEGSVSAIMFNLGYLPGNDHSLSTGADTLAALEIGIGLIKSGGAISVICYPGHPGGALEAKAVEERMTRLGDEKWRVVKYQALGTLSPAPFLLFAVRP